MTGSLVVGSAASSPHNACFFWCHNRMFCSIPNQGKLDQGKLREKHTLATFYSVPGMKRKQDISTAGAPGAHGVLVIGRADSRLRFFGVLLVVTVRDFDVLAVLIADGGLQILFLRGKVTNRLARNCVVSATARTAQHCPSVQPIGAGTLYTGDAVILSIIRSAYRGASRTRSCMKRSLSFLV